MLLTYLESYSCKSHRNCMLKVFSANIVRALKGALVMTLVFTRI